MENEKWFVPVEMDGQLETMVVDEIDYLRNYYEIANQLFDEIQAKKVDELMEEMIRHSHSRK
jgi:hypothetical protein|tara:strand:+ start:147 stop:332 length:186 start_codon:yes stop_codon:yes gene_type:complete